MHASEHLKPWTHPQHYGGFSPEGDFVILTQHRDSELLDRVNWDVACESLKAEAYDEGTAGFATRPPAYHWRAGHCMVGWVEYLCVRADAPAPLLTAAGEIVCALADYPILDESRFSEAKRDAVCEYWERCSGSDRVHELQRVGQCIFAARHDAMPDSPLLHENLAAGL